MKKLCLMLTAALLLLLCACTSEKQADLQPEPPDISESAVSWDGLTFDRELPLSYATQFSVSYAGDDYTRITIGSDQEFLLVAENAETPRRYRRAYPPASPFCTSRFLISIWLRPPQWTILTIWTRSTGFPSVASKPATGTSKARRPQWKRAACATPGSIPRRTTRRFWRAAATSPLKTR